MSDTAFEFEGLPLKRLPSPHPDVGPSHAAWAAQGVVGGHRVEIYMATWDAGRSYALDFTLRLTSGQACFLNTMGGHPLDSARVFFRALVAQDFEDEAGF